MRGNIRGEVVFVNIISIIVFFSMAFIMGFWVGVIFGRDVFR